MAAASIKVAIILVLFVALSYQECRNSSQSKYDLSQPAQIINYFSTCSQFTKRTCCSIKNLDLLIRRIKKTVQSINISPECKNQISQIYCSACDGDWGQGRYHGVCNSNCYKLYETCKNDYFIIDSNNNKLKACRQEDLFCWKLKDIMSIFQLDMASNKARAQICSYFDILGSDNDIDCWRGQISSQFRGRGKTKLNYTAIKKPKRVKKWWEAYTKQIFYFLIVIGLALIFLYKFCRRTRPHYYRLN